MPPKGGSDEWNSILWTVKKIANQDIHGKVYQPLYMSPLPAWLGKGKCYSLEYPTRLDGKTELFGHLLPSIEQILENSFVVAHFFESAFQNAEQFTDDKWNQIHKECLLYKEMEYIGVV